MLSTVYVVAILFLLECLQACTGTIGYPNGGTTPLCTLSPSYMWNATFGVGYVNSPWLMSSSNRWYIALPCTLHTMNEKEAPCSSYIGNLHLKNVVSTFGLCRM